MAFRAFSLHATAIRDVVSAVAANTCFCGSIKAGTVGRQIFADIVFQVLLVSADWDNESTSSSLDLVAIVAAGAGSSRVEGLAEVRSIEALVVDLVLPRSAGHLRRHA